MKFKKMLFAFILVVCCLFTTVVEATVSAPNSFTIIGNNTYLPMLQGKDFLPSGVSTTLHFTYKRNADNQIGYCIEPDDTMVSNGSRETYTRSTRVTDNRILYVLINGLKGKSTTSTYKQDDYFATGIAVWYVMSNGTNWHVQNFKLVNGVITYRGKTNAVTNKINSLVKGADSYTYKDPTITPKSSTAKLTLTSDEQYYMTGNLGVKVTGHVSTYTVALPKSVPNGTKLVDSKGNEGTDLTLSVNSTFRVKVPAASINDASTTFSIGISAKGTEYAAYKYTAANSAHQDMVVLYDNTKNLSASISVNLNLTNKVEISKTDITTGDELPGAELKLVKPDNTFEEWTSTAEPKVFENLAPGQYTLTETIAPEGYIKNTSEIKFTINAAGKLVGGPVVMENVPKAKVPISKKDITTGKELPGAELKLTKPDGTYVEWTSTSTPKVLEDLVPGNYKLIETIAPDGYIQSSEEIDFTIDENGQLVGKPVVMYNVPKSYVYVSKQDITTGEELPGAMLLLVDSEGNEVDSWTSGTYPHRVKEKLEAGTYTLSETIAPEGYMKTTETITFKVKEDGSVEEAVIMYNKPEKVPENPKTGTTLMYSLMIAFVAFAVSFYYYADYKLKSKM